MKLHTINLASYTKPEVIEKKNKDWVQYGEDNNYYQYLIDRYNGSPTNNAIINGISDLIYGKGIDATDSSRKPQEYAMMKSLINPDCMRKVVSDLKLMGQCAFQIIYSKASREVAQIEHMPIQTLRSGKMNADGDVEAYYYSAQWDKMKMGDIPERISAFGMSNDAIEILVVRPYRAGYYYYSPVDYQGGIPYAELEEEVANFHINNIKNGLSPSMLINFNNGVPDEEERMLIEHKIKDKFGGTSNAGNFILAFNENADLAANIEAVPISDAAQQYEFLSGESMQKLMVAHRVTSPMLLGIKDQTGLGNNADEIETASLLFDNTVVRPFQNLLIDALNKILAVNGIALDLYFKTLQPLEFIDRSASVSKEETEKRTGESFFSKETCNHSVECSQELPQEYDELVDDLIAMGEDENLEEWELVDEREVDYDQEEAFDTMIGLASTGTARPNASSEQDGANIDLERFRVRYQYSPKKTSPNSREFCKKMVKANKIYRKEDIIAMGKKPVNAGFGKEGADTYSIWLYKGGARCQHKWFRKTYRFKDGVTPDVNNPNAETISTTQARARGFRPPTNPNKVSVAPKDMKNKGFVNPPSEKDIQTGI
tara:strand:+ start:5279 stop:7081 length:1803 start_codon:yes stop_codon:yes gene_type:complete